MVESKKHNFSLDIGTETPQTKKKKGRKKNPPHHNFNKMRDKQAGESGEYTDLFLSAFNYAAIGMAWPWYRLKGNG